jgi:hypothetical protein
MRFAGLSSVHVLLALLLPLWACRPAPESTCHAQAEALRSRVSRLQWSRVDFSSRFDYQRVPVGAGRLVPWKFNSTAAIDGMEVEVLENHQPANSDLQQWLAVEGNRYTILRPNRTGDDAIYMMATANTRVSFLRRVVEALEPFAIIRLIVRPTVPEEPAWPPAKQRLSVFNKVARRGPYDLAYYELLREESLAAAAGCPKAVELVNLPGLVGSRRIPLLADIFEGCRCAGDMQTLAALYWWMTFDWSRPARWLPWDPELAAQLGEDATYEQLVRALIARETDPVP